MARVEYVVDLTAPDHVERVKCEIGGKRALYSGEAACVLHRFGRPITRFVATAAQVKKIRRSKGKFSITDKMIQRAR